MTLTDPQKDYLSVFSHLLIQNNKFEEAEALLQLLRSSFPADTRIALSIAYAMVARGEYAAALRELDTMPVDINIPNAKADSKDERERFLFAARWLRAKAFAQLGHQDTASSILKELFNQPTLAEAIKPVK